MGVISTRAVVTGSERLNRPKQVQPGTREWMTVIQGINATGWAIPPFIIFQGKHHISAWYKEGIPHDWVIAVSKNGWTSMIQRTQVFHGTISDYYTLENGLGT